MSCREEGDGPEALLWAVALFGGCRPEGEAGSLPVSEHCIRFKPRETHAEADVRGGLSLRDLFTDCFCRRIERGTLGSVAAVVAGTVGRPRRREVCRYVGRYRGDR